MAHIVVLCRFRSLWSLTAGHKVVVENIVTNPLLCRSVLLPGFSECFHNFVGMLPLFLNACLWPYCLWWFWLPFSSCIFSYLWTAGCLVYTLVLDLLVGFASLFVSFLSDLVSPSPLFGCLLTCNLRPLLSHYLRHGLWRFGLHLRPLLILRCPLSFPCWVVPLWVVLWVGSLFLLFLFKTSPNYLKSC